MSRASRNRDPKTTASRSPGPQLDSSNALERIILAFNASNKESKGSQSLAYSQG